MPHLDEAGRARMVDVSGKEPTRRTAGARAVVTLSPTVRGEVLGGRLAKGDALAVARIAGIQAAKETSRLIPLCHPLPLASVSIDCRPLGDDAIEVRAEVGCTAATGVEMEALTAVTVAALALYDMCKSLDKGIRIGPIELLHKAGGRSGSWRRGGPEASA